jgi:hypothetical protein
MVFNKEQIINKIDPNLLILGQSHEIVKYLQSKNSTHPHYSLTLDFSNTLFYKSIEQPIPTLETLNTQLLNINGQIIKENSLKESLLFKILEILAHHINSDHFYRYGVNPWYNLDKALQDLELTMTWCNEINNHSDIETGGKTYDGWNSTLMPTLWACVYAGLIEEGLFISNTIENLIYKIYKNSPKNGVFLTVLDQPPSGRFLMSIHFAQALLYKNSKKLDLAEKYYEKIVQMYKWKGNSPYEIFWTNGLNRITEAAIEVYKLNPTEENKNRAIDYYLSSCSSDDIEPTEATRERGLITYMLMTEVLKIKVA